MAELQQGGSAPETANEGFVPELVVRGSTTPPRKS
jgi:hypothetical protein